MELLCNGALTETPDDVLDGEGLRLVHCKSVARDQWQLDQYRLPQARRQSLLPRRYVDVVEI